MCWYMDVTKISHIDPKVVSNIIDFLESSFGKMTVERGKIHTFVGMNFELLDSGKLKIVMEECIIFSAKLTTISKQPLVPQEGTIYLKSKKF